MVTHTEEFEYRYSGTTVGVPCPDEEVVKPFRVDFVNHVADEEFDPDTVKVGGYLQDNRDDRHPELRQVKLSEINTTLPYLGVIPIDKTVMIASLIPGRRSKQGLKAEYINSIVLGKGNGFPNNGMWHIFNPQYQELEKALALIKRYKTSMAYGVSANLWIGKPYFKDWEWPVLGYRDNIVGLVDPLGEQCSLFPEYENLKEEVGQYIPINFFESHVIKDRLTEEKPEPQQPAQRDELYEDMIQIVANMQADNVQREAHTLPGSHFSLEEGHISDRSLVFALHYAQHIDFDGMDNPHEFVDDHQALSYRKLDWLFARRIFYEIEPEIYYEQDSERFYIPVEQHRQFLDHLNLFDPDRRPSLSQEFPLDSAKVWITFLN